MTLRDAIREIFERTNNHAIIQIEVLADIDSDPIILAPHVRESEICAYFTSEQLAAEGYVDFESEDTSEQYDEPRTAITADCRRDVEYTGSVSILVEGIHYY